MKQIVVAGGTGLVGGHLLDVLSKRQDVNVFALVRRAGSLPSRPRVHEVVFDFQDPAYYALLGTEIPCGAFFCSLGTTIAKARTREAFLKVDRDLPAAFLRQLANLPSRPPFGLVSSVGASPSSAFYFQVKAEVEKMAIESGLPYVIVRPSMLLGERKELRPLERIGTVLLKPVAGLVRLLGGRRSPWLGRFMPIEAHDVALTLARSLLDRGAPPPSRIIEGWELHG